MKKFEYRVLDVAASGFWGGDIDSQTLTDKLNELGRDGWEVISAVDTAVYGGGSKGLIIMLKREIA
ncbi:DUF4177 domain-containing protein [Spirosoma fluminis]